MEKEKNYIIGEESKSLLIALDKLVAFENSFCNALTQMYGEEQGTDFFIKHAPKIEDIARIIMDYLRVNFVVEMGRDNKVINL